RPQPPRRAPPASSTGVADDPSHPDGGQPRAAVLPHLSNRTSGPGGQPCGTAAALGCPGPEGSRGRLSRINNRTRPSGETPQRSPVVASSAGANSEGGEEAGSAEVT